MINKIDAPSHKSTSWNLSFKDPGRPVHLTRPNLTKPFTFFARRRGPEKHQPLNWSSIVHICLFTVALLPRNDRRQPIFWKKWHGDWKSCVSPSDNVVSDCVISTLIEDHFSVYMLVCAHRPDRPIKKDHVSGVGSHWCWPLLIRPSHSASFSILVFLLCSTNMHLCGLK